MGGIRRRRGSRSRFLKKSRLGAPKIYFGPKNKFFGRAKHQNEE
jgi:hypothetical protein